MELIGDSGTFLGVLVTLIVLCVFINSNNFIHEILKEIRKQISEKIEKLEIETNFDTVKRTSDYKLLQRYIDDPKNKDCFIGEALTLDLNIKSKFDMFRGNLSSQFVKPAKDTIQLIEDSKEQVMGPLFALLFCVVVFVGDEIMTNLPCVSDQVVTFISALVILSYLFWGMIWIAFINYVKSTLTEKHKHLEQETQQKCKWFCFCSKISYRKGFLGIMAVNVCVLIFIASGLIPIWLRQFLYVIFVIVPIFVIAVYRISLHPKLGSYSYEFLFRHFSLMFLLVGAITLLFFLGSVFSFYIKEMAIRYENCLALKVGILSFVLFNGLIMPFLAPYIGFRSVLKFARTEAKNGEKCVAKVKADIESDLQKFCEKIS